MNYSLNELFDLVEGENGLEPALYRSRSLPSPGQPDLFGGGPGKAAFSLEGESPFHPQAAELARLSVDAYDAFLHGWMSEEPIEGELIRFARRVIAAGREAARIVRGAAPGRELSPKIRLALQRAERSAAERAGTDRGDADTGIVLGAAARVRHEIHRLLGLLRFSADQGGRYTARCAPDHLVLPALAFHFRRRFGDRPWAVIDERRELSLVCPPGGEPELFAGISPEFRPDPGEGPWEDLWRRYHRAINNEGRKNPALQRQFMPLRYWKYLPEMAGKTGSMGDEGGGVAGAEPPQEG